MNKIDKSFTKHRIVSPRIFNFSVLVFILLVIAMLIAELTIDLRSTSVYLLVPALFCFITILILSKVGIRQQILNLLFVSFIFCWFELHILINPKVFHVVVFWFAIIPGIAIITTGIRQSMIWIMIVMIAILGNGIYLTVNGYKNYELDIFTYAFIAGGIIYTFAIYLISVLLYQLMGDAYGQLKETSAEVSSLHQLSEKKKRNLESFIEVIFKLSKDPDVQKGKIKKVLPRIAELACNTLEINRISIWSLNEEQDECLECLFAFDQGNVEEISTLKREDYPLYFAAIKDSKLIIASDVYKDKNLEEFVENYFKPLQIFSMLDAPFFIDKKVVGVICCENRFGIRQWVPEDLLFLQSLSDLISITYKNKAAKKHVKQIRSQNLELQQQRTIMQELNQELLTTNEMLEEKVKERTAVLEHKNKQLTEYAFINSHLLRAPLARVLGLSNIIVQSIKEKEDITVVNGLITASEELDSVIKKISDLLYKGNDFSRADVEEIIRKNFEKE